MDTLTSVHTGLPRLASNYVHLFGRGYSRDHRAAPRRYPKPLVLNGLQYYVQHHAANSQKNSAGAITYENHTVLLISFPVNLS